MKIDRNERFLALIVATGHFAYFVWFNLETQAYFAPGDTNVWARPCYGAKFEISNPPSSRMTWLVIKTRAGDDALSFTRYGEGKQHVAGPAAGNQIAGR